MVSVKQDSATHNMICLLREWDRAPKEKRRQFLQDFIDQHKGRSGPELEAELAQMASLFLARICVWIKLTYMSGTCLTEQLQALYIFLSASSSHSYLLEFLEHGGVLCLQELCVSPVGKEIDKRWALKVLSCVANAGTRYKETICECYGIRAVAQCMAKSTCEETQEEARNLLEILAVGNPKFSEQVYKGLIAVLPCNSPKAQQLALQSIRIMQATRDSAHRALIDRIIYLLESLHLEVQSAVIELIRDLMRFDLADDILSTLVTLLRPRREIQLNKLSSPEVSEAESSSIESVGSEISDIDSEAITDPSAFHVALPPVRTTQAPIRKTKLILSEHDMKKKRTTKIKRKRSLGSLSNSSKASVEVKKTAKKQTAQPEDHLEPQPLPVFVQQAAAARCIRILAEDSPSLGKKLIAMGCISNLLYAMGNMEYPDGQRQAGLALQHFCKTYPSVDEIVQNTMGPALYEEFQNLENSFYIQLSPLQADVLVSNKVSYQGDDLEEDTSVQPPSQASNSSRGIVIA